MTDPVLVSELNARFSASCTHDVVEAAERAWNRELWEGVLADGFATVGVPEDGGGSGGSAVEACAVLRAAGAYAVPLPLAESGLLAGWLVAGTGPLPRGIVTIAPRRRPVPATAAGAGQAVLAGEVRGVPWAREADHIAVLVDAPRPAIALAPRDLVAVAEAANLAGEPRDTVRFTDAPIPVRELSLDASPAELFRLGGLSRAALISGAIERMAALTLRYTSERCQFGRPIGRFQAVQQHLVTLAEASALTRMAVDSAAIAVASGGGEYEIAAAKTVANRGAAMAAKAAHQAHGAMGMTREYPLHHLSRRLWSWSAEYGNEGYWTRTLGAVANTVGADGLYPLITDLRRAALP
ncbi:MAG TPA: acyl-CoA dehydrogenase family protein [Pseudonocardia sp.]|jgi:acyl-CoA dehydrogenase